MGRDLNYSHACVHGKDSDMQAYDARYDALGNTFSPICLAYLLSPLFVRRNVRFRAQVCPTSKHARLDSIRPYIRPYIPPGLFAAKQWMPHFILLVCMLYVCM